MADPKQAARQERYWLSMIEAKKPVPKLEAKIARPKAKLAKLTYEKTEKPVSKGKRSAK